MGGVRVQGRHLSLQQQIFVRGDAVPCPPLRHGLLRQADPQREGTRPPQGVDDGGNGLKLLHDPTLQRSVVESSAF
jgi:hypothetical protein